MLYKKYSGTLCSATGPRPGRPLYIYGGLPGVAPSRRPPPAAPPFTQRSSFPYLPGLRSPGEQAPRRYATCFAAVVRRPWALLSIHFRLTSRRRCRVAPLRACAAPPATSKGTYMGCTLEELDDTTCRFPIGDPGKAGFHFCGELPLADAPYCARHARVAYRFARTPARPPLNGAICAPYGDGWLMLISPLRCDRRRRRPAVDIGVTNAAEIFARHRRVRTRLTRAPSAEAGLPLAAIAGLSVARAAQDLPVVNTPAWQVHGARELTPSKSPPADGAPPRRIRTIVQAVAEFYSVSLPDIVSPRRTRRLVRPRHVTWFLCRRLTTNSFAEIGRQLGGRDHAAVLHGVRGIARRIATDALLAAEVAAIEARFCRWGAGGHAPCPHQPRPASRDGEP